MWCCKTFVLQHHIFCRILIMPVFAAGRKPAPYMPLRLVDVENMLDINVKLRIELF
jgi:hypothetical protein